MKIKVDHSINIDSHKRNKKLYPSSETFTIKLDKKIDNVIAIRLASMEIPNTEYVITNCSFYFNNKHVVLQDGAYSADELVDYIQSLLKIHVKLNDNTRKVCFSNDKPFTLNFNKNKLKSILGFKKNLYADVTSVTSENILNSVGNNYLFLNVNNYGTLWNNNAEHKYLAKILLDKDKFFVVFDTNDSLCRKHIFHTPVSLTDINIELRDRNDKLVKLNNSDFSFTLVYTVYEDVLSHEDETETVKYHTTYIVNPPQNNETPVNTEKRAYSTKFILKVLFVITLLAMAAHWIYSKRYKTSV